MVTAETVDWSVVFETLANEERRAVLRILTADQGTISVDDVARRLAVDPDDEKAVHRARVQLHHIHLPKLNEAGLIVWSRDQGTVRETALMYRLPVGVISSEPVTADLASQQRQVSD
ncbi:DUF7344 domain-containing protein [Haloarcula salina]|uniref:DUF7344 domain-containing protein n=1 Tax=Haloarcula salina TaxID=1429914 RepID=UPI003C6F5E20